METFQIESCVGGHHIYNLESARAWLYQDCVVITRAGKDHYVKNFGGIKFGDLVKNSPIRQIKFLAKISSHAVFMIFRENWQQNVNIDIPTCDKCW